jgi:hypothetical protein
MKEENLKAIQRQSKTLSPLIPQNRHEKGHSTKVYKCENNCVFTEDKMDKYVQRCPHCNTGSYKICITV